MKPLLNRLFSFRLPNSAVQLLTAGAGIGAALVLSGCIKTTHEVRTQHEIKPIHLTIDVNLRIDRELDDFFGDLDRDASLLDIED